MNKYFTYFSLIFFLLVNLTLKAQNVGINATGTAPDASAGLDVNFNNKGVLFPKVSLSNNTDATTITSPATGLMVYNTNAAMPCGVGYYYNAGTTGAPAWICFTKEQKVIEMFGTATRTAVSSTTHTLQPGLTTTVIIPTGITAKVTVIGDIGTKNTSSTAGKYSLIEAAIYLDGGLSPKGGFNRYLTNNNSTTPQQGIGVLSVSTSFTLTAGSHTIEVRTARYGGDTPVDIGGNCALDVNCGEFTVFVNYL